MRHQTRTLESVFGTVAFTRPGFGGRGLDSLHPVDAGLKTRKPADRCCNYLRKNLPYLRYGECLQRGIPVATGVIEGACRYLAKDRMEVTGARWRLQGAESALRLRALRPHPELERARRELGKVADRLTTVTRLTSGSVKELFERI